MQRPCQTETDCLIFWTYNAMGGIYSSGKFSNLQKIIWFSFSFIYLFVVTVCTIGYITKSEAVVGWDLIQVTWPACGAYWVTIMMPLITWFYSDNFNILFSYLHDRFVYYKWVEEKGVKMYFLKRCDTKAVGLFWIRILTSVFIVYISMTIIDILFICDNQDFYRNLYHHLLPIPYINHVPSICFYWLLYFMESVIMSYSYVLANSEMTFIAMIGSEFNNIVVNLCEQMEFLTKRLSTESEDTQKFDSQVVQRASVLFEKEIKFFIQEHQILVQKIHLLQSYLQLFHMVMMGCVVFIIASNIFVFLLVDLEFFVKLKQFSAFIFCTLLLLVHCEFGTMFNDMTEAVVQQVYNLPWYNFSPKQRKIVYIFLNQVQRPITFKVFGFYPIDLVTLPVILRVAYSWVSILVAGISRNH